MMVAEGTERDGLTMVIQVERTAAWRGVAESYAVGVRDDGGSRQRVLVPCEAAPGQRVEVPASGAIEVPAELPVETALLVPLAAVALRAWDSLRLEIGAAAVVTPGLWSPILSAVAGWYGATPLLVRGAGDAASAGSGVDAETVSRLSAKLAGCPAVCAIELTGRADTVDLLLESVPKYARVLFAGPQGDRLTIDYYVNVHRKGLHLSSTILSPLGAFTEPVDRDLAARVSCLLVSPARAERCHAAVAAVQESR
jgi:threonine dehydrogenase-like Zn-dependent dehydrogenase